VNETLILILFNLFILLMLVVDLAIVQRRAHFPSMKEAVAWSAVWITLALAFDAFLWLELGKTKALEFLTGYLVEQSLSVDNVFVFIVILTYFAVPREVQHRVLFWGVLSAIVFRALFIVLGAALVARFHWILYLLGLFLIFTAIKLALQQETSVHPERNPFVRFARRFCPVTQEYEGGKFFTRREGKLFLTPLFLVLLMIETTDIAFATDSIPAIFAITRDTIIIYTSNIFAVIGLRSLYFVVAGFMKEFRYLKYGLALVLAFRSPPPPSRTGAREQARPNGRSRPMRFTTNGLQIDYDTDGPRTGVPVLFIHGFPFGKAMWKPQVEALKERYHVVSYDVRGHGASEKGDGQYTIELFVDDLLGLADHLRLPKMVCVGLSMGGYIALRAAERSPERFRALVLCDTRSEADGNEGKVKRAAQALAVKSEGVKKFAAAFVKAVFYEKTFQTNPKAVDEISAMIEACSPLAIAGTLIALAARTDTTSALYGINMPTLLLVGQHDTLTPPSASFAMKEKLPNAELHIIPEAAHVSNLENPGEFNRHLLAFLDRLA
jgi:tellurite resistance protein TerC